MTLHEAFARSTSYSHHMLPQHESTKLPREQEKEEQGQNEKQSQFSSKAIINGIGCTVIFGALFCGTAFLLGDLVSFLLRFLMSYPKATTATDTGAQSGVGIYVSAGMQVSKLADGMFIKQGDAVVACVEAPEMCLGELVSENQSLVIAISKEEKQRDEVKGSLPLPMVWA